MFETKIVKLYLDYNKRFQYANCPLVEDICGLHSKKVWKSAWDPQVNKFEQCQGTGLGQDPQVNKYVLGRGVPCDLWLTKPLQAVVTWRTPNPSVNRMTYRHNWKYYLIETSLAEDNKNQHQQSFSVKYHKTEIFHFDPVCDTQLS